MFSKYIKLDFQQRDLRTRGEGPKNSPPWDLEGSDPYIGFLEYRNTPIGSCGSPAQMLMIQRLKGFIPCTDKQLLPKIHKTTQDIRESINVQKQKQKAHYDRTSKDLLHRSNRILDSDVYGFRVRDVHKLIQNQTINAAKTRNQRAMHELN